MNADRAIIVIDDTRIPTIARFCDRLAKSNHSLVHTRVSVGNVFDIFYIEPGQKLSLNHSIGDTVKGWRRYFQGRKFYAELK